MLISAARSSCCLQFVVAFSSSTLVWFSEQLGSVASHFSTSHLFSHEGSRVFMERCLRILASTHRAQELCLTVTEQVLQALCRHVLAFREMFQCTTRLADQLVSFFGCHIKMQGDSHKLVRHRCLLLAG